MPSDTDRKLLGLLYAAGIDTLFNLDLLRQTRDSKAEDPFFGAIKTSTSNEHFLTCLPHIFASYVHVIRKSRSALFGQGFNQSIGTPAEQLQAFGMQSWTSCHSLLDDVRSNVKTWPIKISLLRLVHQESLYNRNLMNQLQALNDLVESAVELLGDRCDGDYPVSFGKL